MILQMKYQKNTQGKSYNILGGRGLGDVVHSFAQPIAKAIDKTVGTNISKCGACAKRREKLNNIFQSELDK